MMPKRGKRPIDLKRTRYQQGSLAVEIRKNGPAVWVYRWRETGTDGQRVKRKQVVGSKADFPTKAAAMRAVEGMRLDINAEVGSSSRTALTVSQVIDHYREKELGDDDKKSMRTKQVSVVH
jgi:integrase